MSSDQAAVLAFLADPATHGGAAVTRIDTHGAIVFLAGARAYKVKRAVAYPYMDFSTLELRRRACLAELALNRRTAPGLYLGVAGIRAAGGGFRLDPPGEQAEGAAAEWAVVMRCFAQEALLDRIAAHSGLTEDMAGALALASAALHAQAEPVVRPGAHGGGVEGMRWVVADNNRELAEATLFDPGAVARLAEWSNAALARRAPLLDRRLADGYVRHCHGDLHLRNIVLLDGKPALFDAIEFNERLSVIDVLYDFAFLLMDLAHRDLPRQAGFALNAYLQQGWDMEGLAALPLFLSQRAAVRAKVGASAVPQQTDGGEAVRMAQEARAYLTAALRYLTPPPPALLAIGGLSGTGKTVVARALAHRLGASPGAVHLRSDVRRKQLLGMAPEDRLPQSAYTPAMNARVYADLLRLAGQALVAGHAVMLDAVHAREEERAAVAALAREAGVPFLGLWLEAPVAVLQARVGARRGDASDATAAVVEAQAGYDLGTIDWPRIDAAGALPAVVAATEGVLAARLGAHLRPLAR